MIAALCRCSNGEQKLGWRPKLELKGNFSISDRILQTFILSFKKATRESEGDVLKWKIHCSIEKWCESEVRLKRRKGRLIKSGRVVLIKSSLKASSANKSSLMFSSFLHANQSKRKGLRERSKSSTLTSHKDWTSDQDSFPYNRMRQMHYYLSPVHKYIGSET